jgi:hypothetical protein
MWSEWIERKRQRAQLVEISLQSQMRTFRAHVGESAQGGSSLLAENGLVIKIGADWGFSNPPVLPAAPPWMSGVEIIHS